MTHSENDPKDDIKCARCWHDREHHPTTGGCEGAVYTHGSHFRNQCDCEEYLSELGAGAEVEAYRG